jgi:chromosome segregation ATPase
LRRADVAARILAEDAETLEEAGRILEHLRVHLAELDRREQNLNGQLTLLDQEQRTLRLRMQQLEEDYAEQTGLLAARETSVDEREAAVEQRDTASRELQTDLDRRESELSQAADQLALDRERLRSELSAELERERQQLAAERSRVDADREQLAGEQTAWAERRELEQNEFAQQLESLRRDRMQDLDSREAAVAQREIDLEKRTRFHEDHLARLRGSLEQTRRELEQQRQQQRVWAEQVEASIRLRLSQLRKLRSLIGQREDDCQRNWDEVAEFRLQQETLAADERELLNEQRRALDSERQSQSADVERQQDLIRLREQELERRAARLDRLRDELERTHREALVLRAGMEEAWTRLSQQAGADASTGLSESARRAVDEYQSLAHGACDARQREVQQLEQNVERQRAELQREREDLAQALCRREERLREREHAFSRQVAQFAARERAWHDARQQAREERQATEGLVRELLEHLETAVAQAQLQCTAPEAAS